MNELEVCVSRLHADDLIQEFKAENYVKHTWSDDEWPTWHPDRPTTFKYKSKYNDLIRVISSHTDSALTPITRYPTTALFNYMDEFSFRCAYRNLTLICRGVVHDIHPVEEQEAAWIRVDQITAQDFQHSEWPAEVVFPPVPFVLEDLCMV